MAEVDTLSIASISKNVCTTAKNMCRNFGAFIKKMNNCMVTPLHYFQKFNDIVGVVFESQI